jgi:hypothetical protein
MKIAHFRSSNNEWDGYARDRALFAPIQAPDHVFGHRLLSATGSAAHNSHSRYDIYSWAKSARIWAISACLAIFQDKVISIYHRVTPYMHGAESFSCHGKVIVG